MSDQWNVGDLALCVKTDEWRGDASGLLLQGGPAYGAVNTVSKVSITRCGYIVLQFEGVATPQNLNGRPIPWCATRFRKIKPDTAEPCEAEFRILLQLSKKRVSA